MNLGQDPSNDKDVAQSGVSASGNAQLIAHLTRRKLRISVRVMTENDVRAWLSSAAGRRITATELAEHLGVSRNTANARLAAGLSTDDLIRVCRALGINPLSALVELGALTYDELFGALDSDGQLISTADDGDLALELARRLLPAKRAGEIDELAARRASREQATATNWRDVDPERLAARRSDPREQMPDDE